MTPPNQRQRSTQGGPHPALAALVGWGLPGAGHMLLGQHCRGRRVMIGMLGLLVAGVLIGGIDAVDSQRDGWWFLGQLGAGPIVIVLDVLNQNVIRTLPEAQQYRFIGLGQVNAVGTLYVALAGLMNIVAILDLFRDRNSEQSGRRTQDDRRAVPGTDGAAASKDASP